MSFLKICEGTRYMTRHDNGIAQHVVSRRYEDKLRDNVLLPAAPISGPPLGWGGGSVWLASQLKWLDSPFPSPSYQCNPPLLRPVCS